MLGELQPITYIGKVLDLVKEQLVLDGSVGDLEELEAIVLLQLRLMQTRVRGNEYSPMRVGSILRYTSPIVTEEAMVESTQTDEFRTVPSSSLATTTQESPVVGERLYSEVWELSTAEFAKLIEIADFVKHGNPSTTAENQLRSLNELLQRCVESRKGEVILTGVLKRAKIETVSTWLTVVLRGVTGGRSLKFPTWDSAQDVRDTITSLVANPNVGIYTAENLENRIDLRQLIFDLFNMWQKEKRIASAKVTKRIPTAAELGLNKTAAGEYPIVSAGVPAHIRRPGGTNQ